MYKSQLELRTEGKGFYDISRNVGSIVAESGIADGLAVVFIQHTSASLVIQENADPSVQTDMLRFFETLVPENDPGYTHTAEGPDDMPSHIRAAMTHTSEVIPVVDGRLALGTWQGLYVFEHRRAPHTRRILVRVMD